MNKKRKCKTCVYRCWLGNEHYCQYILVTGHRRPCRADRCTEYIKGDPIRCDDVTDNAIITEKSIAQRRTGKMDLLHDKAMELYNSGKNDREIAELLGVRKNSVLNWRNKNNLPANACVGFKYTIDYDAVMRLYKDGNTDKRISEKIGCNPYTVYVWRRKNNLEANKRRKL